MTRKEMELADTSLEATVDLEDTKKCYSAYD